MAMSAGVGRKDRKMRRMNTHFTPIFSIHALPRITSNLFSSVTYALWADVLDPMVNVIGPGRGKIPA